MDDNKVINKVINGDRQEFESLVRRYQGPLFNYLGRMGLRQEETEDLVQETFIRTFRHLSRFDPKKARFSTWLFTIARRLGINAMSRRRLSTCRIEDSEQALNHPSSEADHDRAVIKHHISQALLQLPLKYRSPVSLAYLNDMSMAEIAQIEACSTGTVKSRIHRGKKRLKVILADLIGDDHHA